MGNGIDPLFAAAKWAGMLDALANVDWPDARTVRAAALMRDALRDVALPPIGTPCDDVDGAAREGERVFRMLCAAGRRDLAHRVNDALCALTEASWE